MAVKSTNGFPGCGVPDPAAAIGVAGEERLVVRRKGNRRHLGAVVLERADQLATFSIPELCRLIIAARENPPGVVRNRHRGAAAGRLEIEQLRTGGNVPASDGVV